MTAKHLVASSFGLALSFACYTTASAAPILGPTVASFAVLGGGGVTSSGATTINGNVGSAPTNSITGFPPGGITWGTLTSTAFAQQAQNEALTAYNFLAGQTPTQILTGTDLGGLTLTAGVYKFASSAQLTGTLTLDAQGNNNALFIFEIGSTLTTASSSIVSLINGAPTDGIFFQVGSSATLGDSTFFRGNILADTSITLDPFAQIACGRALAGINVTSGAVTMANANHVAVNDEAVRCAGGYNSTTSAVAVPEPGSLALLGISLAGLGVMRRRKLTFAIPLFD